MAIDPGKYSKTYIRTTDLLEVIADAYEDFDYYKDTTYRCLVRPAIFWPDGNSLGHGWAAHVSGIAQKFYTKFKYWGFDNLEDFFCLPIEKRNEFLKNAKTLWETTFREEQFRTTMLEDILNIEKLDNQRQQQMLSSLVEREQAFHIRLVEEAKRIKTECYDNRGLRRSIRNEKARFKAEAKFRQRSQSCRSNFVGEILFRWFELQEGAKSLVGLRKRFPDNRK